MAEWGGRKGLRCVFPLISLSEIMLWEWLKLVRPRVVERNEKRSKHKKNRGRSVSPSVLTRERSSRETRASQSTRVCEAKEKTKAEKDEKKNVLFASLQFHFLFSPSVETFSTIARAFLTYAKIRTILQSIDEFDMLWSLVSKIMICQSNDIWWHLCMKMYWNPEN